MKITGTRSLLVMAITISGVCFACAQFPRFSRPTVKCEVLKEVPKWHRKIHEDEAHEFVFRHYGKNEFEPGLFVHDKLRDRWFQIAEISTEHAKLGRSPDITDIPLQVSWDFRRLAGKKYVALPLQTSGSIVFPEDVSFDKRAQVYRLDCNANLKRKQSLTYFWVRKADFDSIE